MNYLDFEEPIRLLREQMEQAQDIDGQGQVDMQSTVADLEKKIAEVSQEIYSNLSPWQRVQVSRHPDRPYTLDHIEALTDGRFMELHGDRNCKDDKAMVGGLGMIDDLPVMFVGQQKGANTKLRQYRNFGMANPEGYRKALRLMKLAERFNMPVLTFIDTPGAYPGIGAEERNQSEAIARNLFEMARLRVPILCTVVGEGGSGGALAVGVGDHLMMLQYSIYSVISPEGCASILWKSAERASDAAQAMGITASRLKELGFVDTLIKEPLGGAHRFPHETATRVRDAIGESLERLDAMDTAALLERRYERLMSYGAPA